MWLSVSIACLILGVLSLGATIILAVKWDIVSIFTMVTGTKAKKMIQLYKDTKGSSGREYTTATGTVAKTSHVTTESLLSKSKSPTKDLTESQVLTEIENVISDKKPTNSLKLKLTGRFKDTNTIVKKIPVTSDEFVFKDSKPTEILSPDETIQGEQDKISGNNSRNGISTGSSEDEDKKGKKSVRTSIYENKTEILVDDDEGETNEDELDFDVIENEGIEEVSSNEEPEFSKEDDKVESEERSKEHSKDRDSVLDQASVEEVHKIDDEKVKKETDGNKNEDEDKREDKVELNRNNVEVDSVNEEVTNTTDAGVEDKGLSSHGNDTVSELDKWASTVILTESTDSKESEKEEETSSSMLPKTGIIITPPGKTSVLVGDMGTDALDVTEDNHNEGNCSNGVFTNKSSIVVDGEEDTELEDNEFFDDGKTSIITDNTYSKVLQTDYDAIEFHGFKVIEVVTSYDIVVTK